MLASAWVFADGGQRNAIVVPVLPQALQVQIIDSNDDCGCEVKNEQEQPEGLYCQVSIPMNNGASEYKASCVLCSCAKLQERAAKAVKLLEQ